MKKKLRMLIRCGIMLVALVIALRYLSNLLQRKDSVNRYRPFLEQDADFDVLFLGSSHTMNDVYPMELWRDYGIVSYNLGGPANRLATTYWVMKNALDYTSPKLMVVDGFFLGYEIKTDFRMEFVHSSLDGFPLSLTKIIMLLDLMNDPAYDTAEDKEERTLLNMLWKFRLYHERWADNNTDWFTTDWNREKGAEAQIGIAVPREIANESERKGQFEGDSVSIQYLRRIISECQSKGIEVLLTYLPFPAAQVDWHEANRLYEIADEYGVNYINFLDTDIVDFSTDCYDSSAHLNASGARKVTNYLGRYIMEHYDIADQRDNPLYSSWHEDYADYEKLKTEWLKQQTALDRYLMLLADRHYDVFIEVDNPVLWMDQKYVNLARNLGADVSQLEGKTGFIVIDGSERTAQCVPCNPSQEHIYDTILGELRIECSEEGERAVSLDGVWCVTAYPGDGASIRIRALDMDKGERLDGAVFSYALEVWPDECRLKEPVRL